MQNRANEKLIRVQVVENERIIGEELAIQIQELSYAITSIVSNGEDAVKKAGIDKPDIIIMDIKLDGNMDGIKAAKIIYDQFRIPVIYLTAFIDNQTVNRARSTVSYGYIVKPFTQAMLKVTIEMALARLEMEKRFFHLHRVLRTIKNVSKIINKEHNLQILIQEICTKLRTDRSFDHAWIVIQDEKPGPVFCGFAGYDDEGSWIEGYLKTFDAPGCKILAITHPAIITNDAERCKDCKFYIYENTGKSCTLRIAYNKVIYGAIHLSVPADIPLDDEEISLMQELASDIGFAIYAIRQEQERKRIAEKEKLQSEQLMQAGKMASLGILVTGIAHEINNPNNFIMLNAPVLQDVFSSFLPVIEEYAEEDPNVLFGGVPFSELKTQMQLLFSGILTGAERIKRIVDELKNFSRNDELEKFDTINIRDVVASAVVLLSNLIKRSTAHFTAEIGDLPDIKGNYQKLEQVIINLIQNACQALENMEQSIKVTCSYNKEGNNILLEIRDEGRGIQEAYRDMLYHPFFTTRRDIGGTGLGLPISLQIIKKHDGDIQISSEPGKGTTAVVMLPVQYNPA